MQKKIFTLFGLLCLSLISKAQYYSYSYEWSIERIEYDPIKHIIPQGTKTVKYTVKKGHKDPVHSVRQYNDQGKITRQYKVDKDKEYKGTQLRYDAQQRVNEILIHNKKDKTKFGYTYQRNEKGKLLQQEKKRFGKTMYKIVYTYNADGNITEQVSYGKKGNNIKQRITTEYYDQYNKSKTTLYNSKGKVKQIWTYVCKEEGEILEKKKNEIKVCVRKEISENVLTEVYETFDEKGRMLKTIYKYNLPDTSLMEYKGYDDKNILVRHVTYNGSLDKPVYDVFYIKGKARYESKYVYENDRLISTSNLNKGKLRGKAEYTYNKEGFMTSHKWYRKKKNPSSEVQIEYAN